MIKISWKTATWIWCTFIFTFLLFLFYRWDFIREESFMFYHLFLMHIYLQKTSRVRIIVTGSYMNIILSKKTHPKPSSIHAHTHTQAHIDNNSCCFCLKTISIRLKSDFTIFINLLSASIFLYELMWFGTDPFNVLGFFPYQSSTIMRPKYRE